MQNLNVRNIQILLFHVFFLILQRTFCTTTDVISDGILENRN